MGMHPLFFETKIAHLATDRFSRTETEPVGLTPTRLTLLRAMVGHVGIYQHRLWKKLCVCKSTVSVMVRALEKLGFLTRQTGGRSVWLQLTQLAKNALRWVYRKVVRSGYLELVLAIGVAHPSISSDKLAEVIWKLCDPLRQLRETLGRVGDNPWAECTPADDQFCHFSGSWGHPFCRHMGPGNGQKRPTPKVPCIGSGVDRNFTAPRRHVEPPCRCRGGGLGAARWGWLSATS